MNLISFATAALCLASFAFGCKKADEPAAGPAKTRIGYIVKDATGEWFRNEIRFAKEAAAKDGFEIVEMGATDGGAVMNALDSVANKGCQATVLCSPDVKLGPAIVRACQEKNLKLITVDDQLVGADGNPLVSVPHLGISANEIGKLVGTSLYDEAVKRGWKLEETGLLALTHEQLPTAVARVEGAIAGLTSKGFAAARIFKVAQPEQTIASANNAAETVLQKHPEIKHWLICGMNDDAVLGGVRRFEKDLAATDIIGIGINGDAAALAEFTAAKPTGFFGSIQLEARKHGEDTARLAFKWVKDGVAPPPLTLTVGRLMTRDNFHTVRKELGLE